MRRYFHFARETGVLTRIFCAGLDAQQLRDLPAAIGQHFSSQLLPESFCLTAGRLDFAAPEHLSEEPSLAVLLFTVASEFGLDIHPQAYLALARAMPMLDRRLMFEGAANRHFMNLLLGSSTPELHLRRMNEAGVLGALIPEFGRIVGMMQYDGYHTYTVDEHILTAIGHLAQIEQGVWKAEHPLASRIIHEISDRPALYLAMLCHDIAKGTGGDHENKGGKLVANIAKRMGFNDAETALASWLVVQQSLITETAFKRDLEDSTTIANFAKLVASPERLQLLLLLTVADVKAVGPTIWNGWKGALIRDLYHRAMTAMGYEVTVEGTQHSLLSHSDTTMSEAARETYEKWRADPTRAAFHIAHDRFRAVTEIICVLTNSPHAFRNLAGVMGWMGASIVTARLLVLSDQAAVITLAIQNAAEMSFADDATRLAPLPDLLAKAQANQLDFARELPLRRKVVQGREVPLPATVSIDNALSNVATIIEISARDRLGLLYDLLSGFEECGLHVMSAQLATYGRKAVDVFYAQDRNGHKIEDPILCTRLTRVLLDRGNGQALDYII
jgi:[protein-PII] uridylyltransferase